MAWWPNIIIMFELTMLGAILATVLSLFISTGLPTVVTLSVHRDERLFDGIDVVEACQRLEASGVDVVGLQIPRALDRGREVVAERRNHFDEPDE